MLDTPLTKKKIALTKYLYVLHIFSFEFAVQVRHSAITANAIALIEFKRLLYIWHYRMGIMYEKALEMQRLETIESGREQLCIN